MTVQEILDRLGPQCGVEPRRAFSAQTTRIFLRRVWRRWPNGIPTARRLMASGMSLSAAKLAIDELAEVFETVAAVPVDGGIDDLLADLEKMGVKGSRAP